MLSERILRVGFSPTLRINTKAKRLRAEGRDIIDFSVGQPDFPTPHNIKDAAKAAIDNNLTKYTPTDGIPELKKAIIRKFETDNGLEYGMDEIIVSAGGKHSLYNLMATLLDRGGEVIVPVPYWVSYPEMVGLADGSTVLVRTREEDGFKLTPSALSDAISANTRALILNYPSNPTGSTYTRDEFEALADVILKEDLIVISDEIYEKLVFDGFRFLSIASLGEEIKKKTVVVNGVSKAYSMTGWRIGYAAGPAEIIAGMGKIQSHSTSNPTSIAQWAAVEALAGPQAEISYMLAEFEKRRNFMLQKLDTIPGISCFRPQGAFYLFPNVSRYYDMQFRGMQIRNSHGMAYYLLNEADTAVVPGDAFGDDRFIRLSFALSMESIETAVERISNVLARLEPTRKEKKQRLHNTATKIREYAPVDADIPTPVRNALVAEVEEYLSHDRYYEWNANIGGLLIQLRTNSPHLNDFWIENWYPAQLEAEVEPHGIIYAVKGVPGREPRAFYHEGSRTAVLVNTAFYPQLRRLAVGLANDIGERLFDSYAVQAAVVDYGGKGAMVLGPAGAARVELLSELLGVNGAKLCSYETAVVRNAGFDASAESIERKFLMKTAMVKRMPEFARLFARCRCENVVERKEGCRNEPCLAEDDCILDKGEPFCFAASTVSRAMLDPYWTGGPEKHVKRTRPKWWFIMVDDPLASAVTRVSAEEAAETVARGAREGVSGSFDAAPFFNKTLLDTSEERTAMRRRFFTTLFDRGEVYLVNSAEKGFARRAAETVW